ncbi:MAG: hypothetical protein EOL87_16550 [Spartobacteria bacterium]|nr:hypothetical protein [Spartobacteria bacterium]
MWYEKAVLPLYYLRMRKGFVAFQEQLFDWHCDTFFDFRSRLSVKEIAYIKLCIAHSLSYRNVTDLYSFYTYSHNVSRNTGEIDSGRLAYGLLSGVSPIIEPAREIAAEKGMDLTCFDDPNCIFYGFGWDFSDAIEKIYFRYRHFDQLPARLKRLMNHDKRPFCRKGIISASYRHGQLSEEKLYRFTCYRLRTNYAILFSGKRCVEQHNNPKVPGKEVELSPFSDASVQLIKRYKEEQGIALDTYAINKKKGVDTLYFDY